MQCNEKRPNKKQKSKEKKKGIKLGEGRRNVIVMDEIHSKPYTRIVVLEI